MKKGGIKISKRKTIIDKITTDVASNRKGFVGVNELQILNPNEKECTRGKIRTIVEPNNKRCVRATLVSGPRVRKTKISNEIIEVLNKGKKWKSSSEIAEYINISEKLIIENINELERSQKVVVGILKERNNQIFSTIERYKKETKDIVKIVDFINRQVMR